MTMQAPHSLNLDTLDTKLRRWQKQHADPVKLSALYRRKIPDWVIQSMAFENEPVSLDRLKALLKKKRHENPPRA